MLRPQETEACDSALFCCRCESLPKETPVLVSLGQPNTWPVDTCTLCAFFLEGLRKEDYSQPVWFWADSISARLYRKYERFKLKLVANFVFVDHQRRIVGSETQVMQIKDAACDVNAINSWLRDCESSHPDCNTQLFQNLPSGMMVIDCRDLRIVALKPGRKYAALSYTWGTTGVSFPSKQQATDHLPQILPRTVQDAVDLIRSLCIKDVHYLWVDRYCIDQASDTKHEQIQQMHKIYSYAYFTIIAAAGDNAESGLPGVGTIPRIPESRLAIDGETLLSMEDPATSIMQSKWMTRGWTFQEACFSRRRLFFTHKQVSFECAKMTTHEAFRTIQNRSPRDYFQYSYIFGSPLSSIRNGNAFPFVFYVEEYTRRELTYDSDALHAFSGILQALEQSEPRLHHIWAIEIDFSRTAPRDQPKDRLDRPFHRLPALALFWQHKESFRLSYRRPEFPSWSWLGWRGPIVFREYYNDRGSHYDYAVRFWAERLDGTIQNIDTQQVAEEATRNSKAFSHYLYVHALVFNASLDVNPRGNIEMAFVFDSHNYHCQPREISIAVDLPTSCEAQAVVLYVEQSKELVSGNDHVAQDHVAQQRRVHEIFKSKERQLRNTTRMIRHFDLTILLLKQDGAVNASYRIGVCQIRWTPSKVSNDLFSEGSRRTIHMC